MWFLVLWKTVQNDQNTIINTIIIESGGRSIFKGLWYNVLMQTGSMMHSQRDYSIC